MWRSANDVDCIPSFGSDVLWCVMQSSPALRGLANSRFRPENKNTSPGLLSTHEHLKCWMTQIGVRTILHDVQGAEGEVVAAPYHSVCAKRKPLKILIHCFLEGRSIIRVFSLFGGVLEPNPREKRWMAAGDAWHDAHVPLKLRNCWVERWELASSS
jgi:hypothetical protein